MSDLRDQIAEAFALRLNGPASDGRGWYRTDAERADCYAQADAAMGVVQPALDLLQADISLRSQTCESQQLRADLAEQASAAKDTEIEQLQATLNVTQGMLTAAKRHTEQAEATIERAKAVCAELMTIDPADLTRAQRRQLPASVCRAVLAALDQPGGQLPASMRQPVTFHGEDDDRAQSVALHPVDERDDEDQPGDQEAKAR